MEERDPLHGVGVLLPNHVNFLCLSPFFFLRVSIGCVVVVLESRFLGASAFNPMKWYQSWPGFLSGV